MERPPARRAGAEQPRPEPGHLGTAGHGGQPEVRGIAGPARLPLRRVRADGGAEGRSRRAPRPDRRRLAAGALVRPAVSAGGGDRSQRSAAAASHHAQAGQGDDVLARQGRPRLRIGGTADAEGQARRLRPVAVTGGRSHRSPVVIERLSASAVTFPTDGPEQDGTISWDSTTIVLVEVQADGIAGVGYTYGDPAGAGGIRSKRAGRGWWRSGSDRSWPGRSADRTRWRWPAPGGRCSVPCGTSVGRASPRTPSRRSISPSGISRPGFWRGRLPRWSAWRGGGCRSTEAAGSPRTRTTGWQTSCAPGRAPASAPSR